MCYDKIYNTELISKAHRYCTRLCNIYCVYTPYCIYKYIISKCIKYFEEINKFGVTFEFLKCDVTIVIR